VGRFRTTVEA